MLFGMRFKHSYGQVKVQAAQSEFALTVTSFPPLTEENWPLAIFPAPPLTEDAAPLATLLTPPLTEE